MDVRLGAKWVRLAPKGTNWTLIASSFNFLKFTVQCQILHKKWHLKKNINNDNFWPFRKNNVKVLSIDWHLNGNCPGGSCSVIAWDGWIYKCNSVRVSRKCQATSLIDPDRPYLWQIWDLLISFSTFWLDETKCTENYLLNFGFVLFETNLTQFADKLDISGVVS